MTMQLRDVQSSQIARIGHDPETRTLEVHFRPKKEGAPASIYRYDNVSPETHEALMRADSIGKHFGKHIRDANYKFRRVT